MDSKAIIKSNSHWNITIDTFPCTVEDSVSSTLKNIPDHGINDQFWDGFTGCTIKWEIASLLNGNANAMKAKKPSFVPITSNISVCPLCSTHMSSNVFHFKLSNIFLFLLVWFLKLSNFQNQTLIFVSRVLQESSVIKVNYYRC